MTVATKDLPTGCADWVCWRKAGTNTIDVPH